MKSSHRPVRRAVLAAALALAAAPAFAQYSQTVFFGDSLTDSGFFRPFLVQQNPLAGGLGRFTTNPGGVWAEYLANFYGTGAAPAWGLTAGGVVGAEGTNYAAGGARIALQPGFPPSPPTSFAPSLTQQVNAYLARNGGRADPNALFTVWGGANDLFFTLNGLATQPQFIAAAAQEVGLVASLQNAGARYIMVATIPDVGQTPFGLGQGPAGAAGITALVSAYNQALFASLAQGGYRVIPLNTFGLSREISAAPSLYGFTNVTGQACGATSSLVCGPGNYAPGTDTTFAFADSVHPTTGSHKILAEYAISILEGPRQLAILPHAAAVTGRARADRVAGQVAGKPEADGMRWWADARVDYQRYSRSDAYSGEGPAITAGINWSSGNLVYGGFAGFGRQTFDFGRKSGDFSQSEATLGGFAGWYGDAAWVAGQASYSQLGYDVDRSITLGPAQRTHSGSPDGSNLSASLGAGWTFRHGNVQHGPVIGVLSQQVDIDGYAEGQPDLSTSLAFPDQSFDSLIGSAGWQASWTSSETFKPYARLTWDREFERSAEQAFAQVQSLPGTLPYAVPGVEFDRSYGTLGFGARTRLLGFDANLGTSLTLGQQGGNNVTVYATFGSGF